MKHIPVIFILGDYENMKKAYRNCLIIVTDNAYADISDLLFNYL